MIVRPIDTPPHSVTPQFYLGTCLFDPTGNSMMIRMLPVIFCLLQLLGLPVYARAESVALDREQVSQSIDDMLKVLKEVYVFPENVPAIEEKFARNMEQGLYDHVETTEDFVESVSADLADFAQDGHMSVMLARSDATPSHVLIESVDERKNNYGFQKVEILKGNVGYVKWNKFYADASAKSTVDDAFGFLGRTSALIVDLRDNIGGSPELARYILSHFYEEPTLLWRFHSRGNRDVYDHLSIAQVGSEHFKSDFPLYVLVGTETGSAAELFAYTLKHSNKATLIGAQTRGIAHAVGAVSINQYFDGRFSMASMSNPVTNKDWEKVGVIPDIVAEKDKSLMIAHDLAMETLGKESH
ncbi:MAG: S41 family peptidase [Gammaproteobacteria bacterium]